jgi:hypothetical protein
LKHSFSLDSERGESKDAILGGASEEWFQVEYKIGVASSWSPGIFRSVLPSSVCGKFSRIKGNTVHNERR